MFADLSGVETDPNTAALESKEFAAVSPSTTRRAMALRSLMDDWEHDSIVEEDESETELMVLLSGMVNTSNPLLGDASG